VARRIVRIGYRVVSATPLRGVLRSRPVQRLKKKIVEMPPELVPPVLEALESAGVRAWAVGGWGIDALLGEQTRRHYDLDLAFDARDDGEARAVRALVAQGFQLMGRDEVPTSWLSTRIAFSDGAHVVDLHPAPLSDGKLHVKAGSENMTMDEADAFATGTVAGRTVNCLSAALQVAVHRGYEQRENDRRDMARLREKFDLELS
jgi:lincosamide nucleotidyltransferase A/C/D/E